jgi:hypothetical protein
MLPGSVVAIDTIRASTALVGITIVILAAFYAKSHGQIADRIV